MISRELKTSCFQQEVFFDSDLGSKADLPAGRSCFFKYFLLSKRGWKFPAEKNVAPACGKQAPFIFLLFQLFSRRFRGCFRRDWREFSGQVLF